MPSAFLSIPSILEELDKGATVTLQFANRKEAEYFRIQLYTAKRKGEKMFSSIGFTLDKRSLSFKFPATPATPIDTGKVDEVTVTIQLVQPRTLRTFNIVNISMPSNGSDS